MCAQCFVQAAPFVGVAVTMLNRRNLKSLAMTTWRGVPGGQRPAPPEGLDPTDDGGGLAQVGDARTVMADRPADDHDADQQTSLRAPAGRRHAPESGPGRTATTATEPDAYAHDR